MRPSMGSVGDAYDNALCESFFATLECELLDRRRFASQVEARMASFSFIEGFYNPPRRHSALGYRSPLCYEQEMQTDRQSATPEPSTKTGQLQPHLRRSRRSRPRHSRRRRPLQPRATTLSSPLLTRSA